MNENNLTLAEALDILDINNIDSVLLIDLPKIKRKAYVKWHPDKIAHTGDKTKIELYEAKTKLIEPAIEIINKYLNGEYDSNQKFDNNNTDYNYNDPIDILRKNATMMNEELNKVWNKVKETNYMKTEEDIVYSEGHKLKDMLNSDLEDDIVPESIMLWFIGFVTCFILTILLSIMSYFAKSITDSFIDKLILSLLGFHTLICLLKIFPLSRYYLPTWLNKFIYFYSDLIADLLPTESGFWSFITTIGNLVGFILKYIVVYPIYFIAKLLIGETVFRRVVKKEVYYANIAEWYINKLLNTNPNKLEDEQLFHLAHLYNNLTKVNKQ